MCQAAHGSHVDPCPAWHQVYWLRVFGQIEPFQEESGIFLQPLEPSGDTDLPGLRVLILNARQWDRPRASDRRPAKLAAAERVGTSSLRETAEWCEWLAQRPFRLDTCSGTIERR
ncbi:hypothetical protein [Saccharopolyspora shandongensis]|uniref:hypothetical protein n=1 Tax=Saccharopolyspora shandongensis TaxID=418495 RepID=UPI0033F29FEC